MRNVLFFISTITLVCWAGATCMAQRENIWVFGQNAGLDFNTTPPSSIKTAINGFGEASASVCDPNGRLLFYTEGNSVWNRNHDTMANGRSITINSTCNQYYTPTSSAVQGALIVPFPEDPNKYYIFSLIGEECYIEGGQLYYSVVDMTLNGGLGDVVANEKGILIDKHLSERMTAVVGDNCNIWILTVSRPHRSVKAFEITHEGVHTTPVISSGLPDVNTESIGFVGSIVVSPGRNKVAITTFLNSRIAYLCDFDPSTGIVSHPFVINDRGSYGACFSPDNNQLYISGHGIYQFDLTNSDPSRIIASRMFIGEGVSALKLGPDRKIYFRDGDGLLGVIGYPDLRGLACGYTTGVIAFQNNTGASALGGFPNVVPLSKRDTIITSGIAKIGCFAPGISLSAQNNTPGRMYRWNTGDTTREIEVKTPGVYYVTYYSSSSCSYHIDTLYADFSNGRLPGLEAEASCKNESNGKAWVYTDVDDTVSYRYRWIDNKGDTISVTDTLFNVNTGNYILYMATSGGCDTIMSFLIPEYDYEVSFSLSDSLICSGDSIIFNNTSHDYFNNFVWVFGDRNSSDLYNPVHFFPGAGGYQITLTGKGDKCADTAQREIFVDVPMPDLSFSSNKESICVGEEVQLTVHVNDRTLTALHWQLENNYSYIAYDIAGITHSFGIHGDIPIWLTAAFRACPDISVNQTITVHPIPLVDLGADSVICLKASPIILQNKPPDQEGYHYLWSTGAVTRNILVTQEGEYRLWVSNASGCTAQEHIMVSKDCYTDIPNAFTPNGDGINDYFFPRHLISNGTNGFRMQILNRWGQKVFETVKTSGRGWDGKFNEHHQPVGTYIYIIEILMDNGKAETYEGNVTLLR